MAQSGVAEDALAAGGAGAETGPGAGRGSPTERLGPEAGELAAQLVAQLRTPGVLAVLLSAAYAALAVLAAGFLLAAAFSDDSLIGYVGRDAGIVSEAFRQVVQMLLADVLSIGLFDQQGERLGPAILAAVPIGACAVAAATQASSTEGSSRSIRLAFGAATGIPFALLMLVAALAAGSSGDVEPSLDGAFGFGLLWGALGGLAGTAAAIGPGATRAPMPARLRTGLAVVAATLRPLGVLLLVSAAIGLSLVLVQTAAGVGRVVADRSQPVALLENTLYVLEHGLHFAELGALVEFEPPGSLGAFGLPLPVEDVTQVTGGDRFRIFGYRGVLASFIFVPLLLVGIVLPVLLALYAGFAATRLQGARTPVLGAAWGAIVGPSWALAMGIADAIVGGRVFGSADADSVFATFLLGGTALGAVGGLLAARSGPRAEPLAAAEAHGQSAPARSAATQASPARPPSAADPAAPPTAAPDPVAPEPPTGPTAERPTSTERSSAPSSPPAPGPSAPPSSPGHPGPQAPSPAPPDAPYEPIAGRARAVRVLLLISVVLSGLAAISDGLALELLDRMAGNEPFTSAETAANDIRQGVVGLTLLAVSLATAVLFVMWFSRAYRNLPRLGVGELRYGPGWAIGAWFVPILNLFRPKQIADDLWRGSDPDLPREAGDRWRAGRVPTVFAWWWALWVISYVVDTQSARMVVFPDTPSELFVGTALSLAGYVLSIPAGLLAMRVVRLTTERQETRAARLFGSQSRFA
jgi:hypothetical protein